MAQGERAVGHRSNTLSSCNVVFVFLDRSPLLRQLAVKSVWCRHCYEHRSAGGSWEEPVSTVRNAPLRRSQRLNSTLDTSSVVASRQTINVFGAPISASSVAAWAGVTASVQLLSWN
ncbi:unnamed protein product [Plutella xylostella]|uniref:(diamondback moth) hypothetical protein n=1 Tax=Plutella xylostella TaxID=51655 RepID=A0A8S4DI43_PLUXY|nr:unnamed protein product [Plutella xylostella]